MTEEENYTDIDISDVIEESEQFLDSEPHNSETVEGGENFYTAQDSEPLTSEDLLSTEKKAPNSASKSEVIRSTRLPMARIKNIMKMDPDVSVVSGDAVFLVTKATVSVIKAPSITPFAQVTASLQILRYLYISAINGSLCLTLSR